MPLNLDIGFLRAYGKKPDEELLPEDDSRSARPVVHSKLRVMNFSLQKEITLI